MCSTDQAGWQLTFLLLLRSLEVDRAWGVFAHVLLLGQFAQIDFFLVLAFGIREAVVLRCFLSREGQLAERGVGLLRVKGLGKRRQVCRG